MNIIAHYAFLTASAFAYASFGALLLLLVIVATNKKPAEGWVWEVPAVVAGLGTFWGAVAVAIRHVL
jgi:uncharacterized integral membrane protein